MCTYKTLWSTVCVLLLLSSPQVMSQDIELAGFSFARFPGAVVKGSPLNREIEVNEYNFFVNLPKQLKNEKTVLINRLQYRLVSTYTDNDLNMGLDGQGLHLVGYRLTVLHQLMNDWRAVALLNPMLSSTFSTALEGDDFLFNGALLFIKKKSDRFSYGGGFSYTSRFGNPIPIPTFQLALSSEKSKLQVLLPIRIAYDRYVGKFTAGLKVAAIGSRYNVNYTRTNALNDSELVDKLTYSRVVLGPVLSYRAGRVIKIEASGGLVVARRMELQGDLFEDANYDIVNGSFFRLGIAIIRPKNTD